MNEDRDVLYKKNQIKLLCSHLHLANVKEDVCSRRGRCWDLYAGLMHPMDSKTFFDIYKERMI